MNKFITKLSKISKKLLPLIIFIFILILVLKQIGLYNKLLTVYNTCLPIVIGGVIAFLIQPLIDRLQQHVSMRKAVFIVYFGIICFLSILVLVLVPLLYNQILDITKVLPDWIEKIETFLANNHISYDKLNSIKETYIQDGYIFVMDSLKQGISTVGQYGIAFFTAFFISIDLDFYKRTMKKVLPNFKQFTTFYLTMSNIVYQYLIGTLLDLLFIIVSVGIILVLGNFPNGLLYAIVLALLNLFPYVGATIGLLIIAIVGMLSYDQFPFLLFLLVWIIQQIEANIIQPIIFNHTMNVRPILTFVFIFISDAFFGIPGVILSPIIAAIAQIAFRSWLHAKTSDRVGEWEDIWQDFDDAMKQEETIHFNS